MTRILLIYTHRKEIIHKQFIEQCLSANKNNMRCVDEICAYLFTLCELHGFFEKFCRMEKTHTSNKGPV